MNSLHQHWQDRLPAVIFVGGKKRSGKDFLCDRLVEQAGFRKVHIVEPWLRQWAVSHGYHEDEWETVKFKHRAEIQADANVARETDPMVLVRYMRDWLPTLPKPICVTAVRFTNEMQMGMQMNAMCLRVDCPDEERKQRFLTAGETLALFDDPFEHEIDTMPVNFGVPGNMPGWWYVPALCELYRTMLIVKARGSLIAALREAGATVPEGLL